MKKFGIVLLAFTFVLCGATDENTDSLETTTSFPSTTIDNNSNDADTENLDDSDTEFLETYIFDSE